MRSWLRASGQNKLTDAHPGVWLVHGGPDGIQLEGQVHHYVAPPGAALLLRLLARLLPLVVGHNALVLHYGPVLQAGQRPPVPIGQHAHLLQ